MHDDIQSTVPTQDSGLTTKRCPYLGLRADPTSVFTEPTEEHRCYVGEGRQRIELDHQADFCMTSTFEACPRFVTPPEREPPSAVARPSTAVPALDDPTASEEAVLGPPPPLLARLMRFLEEISMLQLVVWVALAVFAGVALYAYLTRPLPATAPPTHVAPVVLPPSPSPTKSPTETPTAVLSTPTPAPPTATLAPGRLAAALVPAGNGVGWVSSGERLNHFGDRNLHVGVFRGLTYHGAMQFSLASIPLGSRIERVTVELVGLSAENLGADGTWALRLLGPEVDENWPSATYEQIHNAPVVDTIPPELSPQDLAVRRVNVFTFTPAQRRELERRLPAPGTQAEVENGLVSFRLDGPTQGEKNLFTWDTGYGGGFGSRPVLRVVYQPPPTPTPLLVTATASPANVLTVAALAATATYEATAVGTPTPGPPNVVTPTPPFIVTHTPTPGNRATAQWVEALATAQAFLYGTPTPLPTHVWTATPVPTPVIITSVPSTPTPENVLTAAAILATATYEATAVGTPTPWPPNVVTPTPPFIVTHTPTPGNIATAQWVEAVATAEAFLYGTPTPLPTHVWTATPLPPYIIVTSAPSTPTPENVLTVAAILATATYEAATTGTPTPWPANVVTPTPPFIVTNTPTPGSRATAQWVAVLATAQAFVHGTPTPLPTHVWTATPAPPYVIVTSAPSTPTPENVVTAAAILATATYEATTIGTPTPWPPHWVTPVIIVNTPTPENKATAAFLVALATARAFVQGTPTPLPPNVWTATPVPLLIPLHRVTSIPTSTPTPTVTPMPSEFPAMLRGKIAFRSDRFGGDHILVMEPDGSNVALLTSTWVYEAAQAQKALSPDGRVLIYQGQGRHGLDLFLRDLLHGVREQLTRVGMGMCYDAAWSPDNIHIVFASNQDGDDEIFAVTRDGGPVRQLTHNGWQWDKHPTYSPDGERIAYCSNAVTGHMQIWVMNADGSEKHNISDNEYSDWDPVWIR